ncbi:MAG: acetyl-CoA acetyltransferase [Saprospiraceae bacterium]|nr:MAG: acetyl-CoA acetyltransferase [Saprospiraceae bacterium]
MKNEKNKVAIIGGARIPFAKSFTKYSRTTNNELMSAALNGLVGKYGLAGAKLGEVALGTLIHYPTEWNWAKENVLNTALDPHTPVQFISRACGTSLDAANSIALKITTGQIEAGIAGGSDTNSDVPLALKRSLTWDLMDIRNAKTFGERFSKLLRARWSNFFKPLYPDVREPRTKMSMGEHTELTVKNWKIGREAQDELAFLSHKNAQSAYEQGFHDDLIVEFKGIKKDTLIRPDTTMEGLAKLRPAFDRSPSGTLTAGNSSPFTDGAAAVFLASEAFAKAHNYPIQAYLVDVQNAAFDYVHGEDLLLAPTVAVSNLLKRNKLFLQDFDFYEIHEAFAGQVLATLKAWESDQFAIDYLDRPEALGSIDRGKLNVKGGSLAIGHPFAATGARILANAAKILQENGGGRCLISICTAGGMGTAAIVELR